MSTPEERLAELGLSVPEVAKPVAVYIPAVRSGNHVFTSGQLPMREGQLIATGKYERPALGIEVALHSDAGSAVRRGSDGEPIKVLAKDVRRCGSTRDALSRLPGQAAAGDDVAAKQRLTQEPIGGVSQNSNSPIQGLVSRRSCKSSRNFEAFQHIVFDRTIRPRAVAPDR